jgi:peroxiredoxin
VTVCARDTRPLVLTFVVTRGTDCEPQVDRVERVRRQFPGAEFVTVVSGDSREETEALAQARRWRQPVAVDEDGSVVNLYGIGICPVTIFAREGRVRDLKLGNLTEAQLRRRVERLVG